MSAARASVRRTIRTAVPVWLVSCGGCWATGDAVKVGYLGNWVWFCVRLCRGLGAAEEDGPSGEVWGATEAETDWRRKTDGYLHESQHDVTKSERCGTCSSDVGSCGSSEMDPLVLWSSVWMEAAAAVALPLSELDSAWSHTQHQTPVIIHLYRILYQHQYSVFIWKHYKCHVLRNVLLII